MTSFANANDRANTSSDARIAARGLSRRSFLRMGLGGVAALAAAPLLSACGSAGGSGASGDKGAARRVCFVEVVENDAFVAMQEGFRDELAAQGFTDVTYEVKNAQGDTSTLNQIASQLKAEPFDLIVPIATPAAQAVVNAELDVPVVFVSVADPVAAGVMGSLDAPDKGATGTSNDLPVDEVYAFGTELMPAAGEGACGILYCSGEANAVSGAEKMHAHLDDLGVACVERTVTNSSECQQAAQALARQCSCIYVPVDSVVQSAMAQVTATALEAGVPVFGSDPVMAASGALCSVAVGNATIGAASAEMAAQVLAGTPVEEIPAQVVTDYERDVCRATAEALGVAVPDDGDVVVL